MEHTDMVTDMKQEDDDLEVVDPLAENDSDNCSMMIVRKSTNSLADHNTSSLDDDQFDSIPEIDGTLFNDVDIVEEADNSHINDVDINNHINDVDIVEEADNNHIIVLNQQPVTQPVTQADNLGEGGTFIQGTLSLSSTVRSALFSHQLDSLISEITCSACDEVVKSFTSWRVHCQTKHALLHGYTMSLVPTPESERSNVGDYPCPLCSLSFPSPEARNEHITRIVRTVRLVCPQCQGQYSDLETHVKEAHSGVESCGFCGLETKQLIVHCHTLHSGFASVLSEVTVSCYGDKQTLESFESVFSTPSKFLATEVKPSVSTSDPEPCPSPPKPPSQPVGGISMVPLAMVGSPQILQTSEGAKQAPPQNITMEKLSQPLRLIAPKLVSGISLSSAVSSAGVPVSVVMAPSATSPLTLPGNIVNPTTLRIIRPKYLASSSITNSTEAGLPVITSVSHNQSYVNRLEDNRTEVSRQDWKKGWGPVGLSRGDIPTSETLAENRKIRERNNEEDFKRFMKSGGRPSSHDCEICGFQPYTKNKYRERQDHLVRTHFRERMDQIIPIQRNYYCPFGGCDYEGKDRQDILRHYTGKHNILKIWVMEFINEQMNKNKHIIQDADKDKLVTLCVSQEKNNCILRKEQGLTFAEMQAKANAERQLTEQQRLDNQGWRRSSKMTGAEQLQQALYERVDDEIRVIETIDDTEVQEDEELDAMIYRLVEDDEVVEPAQRQYTNDMFRARRESALGLGDLAFKRRFGFTKAGFEELLQYCGEMEPTDNRGNPIPANIKIMDALTVLRGNTFLEEAGHNNGVSGNGSFISLHQFVEVITNQKQRWLCMPTRYECTKLAETYNTEYGLDNLPIGIDGKLFRIQGMPRFRNQPGLMDPQKQDYWSYKNCYAINGQCVGDGTYFRDVTVHTPGRFNDASIYAASEFSTQWTTNYRPFCCAGDSAYPSTVGLVTPFTEREIDQDPAVEANQREFNKRHSQIRTIQTENMFGRLMKQFPVLNQLRYFMEFNQKVILTCIILFNMKAFMRERDDVENDSDDENVPNQRNDNHQNQDDIQVYMLPESIQRRRVEGQLVRRNMMNRMLPR